MPARLATRVQCALTCAALLAACSALRRSYPTGALVEFQIACVRNLWPGPPAAPLDLRESFCACVVRECQGRFDADEFDQLRVALAHADYRPDAAGVPPAFAGMLATCRADLDRGTVPVR